MDVLRRIRRQLAVGVVSSPGNGQALARELGGAGYTTGRSIRVDAGPTRSV